MIEELSPNLHKIEVPLPRSPLKATNSYVIKGDGRFLIVDTGMNREECLRPLLDSLKKLNVDLAKTDLFITHLHADHLGLSAILATDSSKVYFDKTEAAIMARYQTSQGPWYEQFAFFVSNGFPEAECKKGLESHPGVRFSTKKNVDFSTLKDGDKIEIGDYLFKCIETPGHSPGHMVLYEANKKILICGDHILFDITPNITWWPEMDNSLKRYLENLEKVYGLEVELVLPGHRRIWDNHRQRITEIKEHHQSRLKEALSALGDGPKTAWQVAPHITWDIDCDSWAEFPPTQKWFAFGETIAHLDYLVADGRARKDMRDHQMLFSLVK